MSSQRLATESSAQPVLRVARPANDLDLAERMYCTGLGLQVLAKFEDHKGFDGVVIGLSGWAYHLEFTRCRHHPVNATPTVEDLMVFYVPDHTEWLERCDAMTAAGFQSVESFNPYWDTTGRTFVDPFGYRVVIDGSTG